MFSKQIAVLLLVATVFSGCRSGSFEGPIEEVSDIEEVSKIPESEPTEEQLHPAKFYAIEPSELKATATGEIKFVSQINTYELAFSADLVPFKLLPDRNNVFPELYLFRPLVIDRLNDGTEVPASIEVYNFPNDKKLSVQDWLLANTDRFSYAGQDLTVFRNGVRYQTSGYGNSDIVALPHKDRVILLKLHYYAAPEALETQEWVAYFNQVLDALVLKD